MPSKEDTRPRRPEARGWVDYRVGYHESFNGFRGFAILTFVLYHGQGFSGGAGVDFFNGAFLWLEMFFVQSGFLITSLLYQEWYATGTINLPRFFARRALRLLPALVVVAGVCSVWIVTFGAPELKRRSLLEVFATLFYVNNWFQIFDPARLPTSMLPHGWSLSVEEQFYLVVPFLLLLVLPRIPAPRAAVLGWCSAAAGAAWMVFSAVTGASLSRIYLGTDTRAGALFIGVALALTAAAGLVFRREGAHRLLTTSAWVAVGITLVLLQTENFHHRSAYYGFFTLASLCFAVILAHLVQSPAGLLARMLSWRPLARCGLIAYGLYLWHWPLMIMTWTEIPSLRSWPEPVLLVFWVLVSLAVAATSWVLVERPMLRLAARLPDVRRPPSGDD